MQVKKLNVSKREHTPLRLLQEQYIFSKNPLAHLYHIFFNTSHCLLILRVSQRVIDLIYQVTVIKVYVAFCVILENNYTFQFRYKVHWTGPAKNDL